MPTEYRLSYPVDTVCWTDGFIRPLPPEQYDPEGFIKRTVEAMADGETYVLVFHPGYLDAYILRISSLLAPRTLEVEMATGRELKDFIKENHIQMITYDDL